MKKYILKLALFICIVSTLFVLVSITASAASNGKCGDNLTWTLSNGTLTISGSGAMNNYSSGNNVVNSPWFSSRSNIVTVKIEDGVTSIGDYSFRLCANLKTITIPESVTYIGDDAFSACSRLEEVNWNAKNVTDFSNYNYIFDGAGKSGNGIKIIFGDEVESIPSYAFCPYAYSSQYSPKIASVSLGNNISNIGDYAFSFCTDLTNITIPESVVNIGDYAFRGCTGLTSITIPESVTSISDYVFRGCTGLTSITIPDNVTSIGDYAFSECTGLTSMTIPESVTNIGDYAFSECTGLTSMTIPESVTNIGGSAFQSCTSLEKITLPFIGSSREANGTSDALFGHVFGNGNGVAITQYYSSTAYSTYKIPSTLNSVTITDADIIPYGAFYGCNSLDNITLNNGVKTIYSNAFYNCSNLMDITIMSQSVKTPNSNIFTGCDMLTIHGIEDSDIEEYATKYELDFEPIDESAVGITTLTASAEVIEGKIVVTVKANGITSKKFMPVAVYDKDNVMLDLIIIPTNENFEVMKVVFKDIKDASFVKLFMWNSYDDLVPLDTAKEVTIVRNQL